MSWLWMFRSNHGPGRPSPELYDFKRLDLDGRRQMMRDSRRRRSLLVWFLHDCDDGAAVDPARTLKAAEIGIEAAEDVGDPDLTSWAYSGRGNLKRLLRDEATALEDLEVAVRLAEHPYQKADATRRLGVLMISDSAEAGSVAGLEAGIAKVREAGDLCSELPRLYTDRGHTMRRLYEALGHLHLSNFRDGEREVAVPILEEVLRTGDLMHAKRARSAALLNLASSNLNFEEKPNRCRCCNGAV